MATIVGAFGVPHMPTSPGDCAANPESLVARAFAAVRAHVDDIDPDVLVVFDTDHFHHWFYDRLPAFAIGIPLVTGSLLRATPDGSWTVKGMLVAPAGAA